MGDQPCKCIIHHDTNIVDTMLCEVHPVPNYLAPAPSPARDDAETCPKCGDSLDKHPTMDMSKGVLFLCPMAAPDELTASERDELEFLRERKAKYMAGLGERFGSEVTALAELDALRERIAAVRVLLDDTTTGGLMIERAPIRAALGDA